MEDSLSESETGQGSLFERLLEAAPDAIVIVDGTGRITIVNAQTEQLFGYQRKELLNQTIELLVPERFRAGHPVHRERYSSEPGVRPMGAGLELYGRRKDGTEFPVEISLSPLKTDQGILTMAAIRDITDRKAAEAKFRNLLESAPDAMVIVNEEGRIVLINAQTERLFGYKRHELLDHTVETLVPERYRSGHSGHRFKYSGHPEARAMGEGLELYGRRKDGTEFPVEISLSPIQVKDERLVVSAIRDITDRKQAERALQEQAQLLERRVVERTTELSSLNAELAQANRMKDEFIATLSHELRTPLTSITGWVHMLQEGELPADKRAKALQVIDRNLTLQAQLIDDLLNVSRIVAGKIQIDLQSIFPAPLIQDAIDSLRPTMAAKKLRFTCDLDKNLGPLRIDAPRFHQIVWNLLSNAVKFTANEGHIDVTLRRSNSHALLQVSDSGEGIACEFLPHVFDRFRQADSTRSRKHGGLGVGLAIVKHFVELHGGKVLAESGGIGQGSTFKVALPIPVFVSHPTFTPRHTVPGRATLGMARILVVEDEPDTRDMIAQALEQRQASTMQAGSAEEAFQFLENHPCDLVISDIGMPHTDGYQFIRKLRSVESPISKLPAIALTAYAGDDNRRHAIEAGFNTHIAKPVKLNEMIRAIVELLGEDRERA